MPIARSTGDKSTKRPGWLCICPAQYSPSSSDRLVMREIALNGRLSCSGRATRPLPFRLRTCVISIRPSCSSPSQSASPSLPLARRLVA